MSERSIHIPEQALQLTEVGDFDRQTEGYIIIEPLPEVVKEQIYEIQGQLATNVNPTAVWLPHGDQLHVTFAHIVSPDANYPVERSDVFRAVEAQATTALQHAQETIDGDTITFEQLKIFPGAIILQGTDNGAFAAARQQFTGEVSLPEGTRKPPAIIHTTIARFREQVPLNDVHTALAGVVPHISAAVSPLQLVQEHAMYTQSHTVIKEAV